MQLNFSDKQVEVYCHRWKITELAVFGSLLRDDSDVNVLVTFAGDARWSLFDLVTMQDQIKDIVGREVDLMTRKGVEQSRNPIRREAILRSARPIYQAA